MARSIVWRVRVKRSSESWVEVQASSAAEAEIEAAKVPSVISVFGKSAIRGDESAAPDRPAGVRDD